MRHATIKDIPTDQISAALSTAASTAKTKGAEILDSDAAHELARRGREVLSAARGQIPYEKKRRRWPLAVGFFGLGAAASGAVAYFLRPLENGYTSYTAGPAADVMAAPTTSREKIDLTTAETSFATPTV